MLNDINEGFGKDVLEAFGGTYPDAQRAPFGSRITDETYQAILSAIQSLVAAASSVKGSVETGIVATGTNQATAYQLSKTFSEVATSDGSNGVRLNADTPIGSMVTVSILSSNTTNIYPHVGGKIDLLPTNEGEGTTRRTFTFWRASATQWYAVARQNMSAPAPP